MQALDVLLAIKDRSFSLGDEAHRPIIVAAMQDLDTQREASSRSANQWFDPPVGFAVLVNQFVACVAEGKNNPTYGISRNLIQRARMSLVPRNATHPTTSAALRSHLLRAPGPSAGIGIKRGTIAPAERIRLCREYIRVRTIHKEVVRLSSSTRVDNKPVDAVVTGKDACFDSRQLSIWKKIKSAMDGPITAAAKKQYFQSRDVAKAYERALRAEATEDPSKYTDSIQMVVDNLADYVPSDEKKSWGTWNYHAEKYTKELACFIVDETLASRASDVLFKRL